MEEDSASTSATAEDVAGSAVVCDDDDEEKVEVNDGESEEKEQESDEEEEDEENGNTAEEEEEDDDDDDEEEDDEEDDDEEDDDEEEDDEEEDDDDYEDEEEGEEEEEGAVQQEASQESESDGENAQVCAICLDKLRRQTIGSPEACDHQFCLDCICEWSKNTNTCPVDRLPFNIILAYGPGRDKVLKRISVKNRTQEEDIPEEEEDITYCEVCGHANSEDRLLLCDGCDLGYHCECLTPPLAEVPVEEWFCPTCAARNEEAIEGTADEDEASPLMFPRRQIARTRVSERVRQRIQTMRMQRRPLELMSSDEEEMDVSTEDTASAATASTPSTSRTTTRRKTKRRKTTKKRKTASRKSKSPKKGKTKRKATTRRKGKKRKTRGKKKATRKRQSPSAALARAGFSLTSQAFSMPMSRTIKGRIADRLGLSVPPQGRTIPLKRRPERDYDRRRSAGGSQTASAFSIMGSRDELIAFQDGDDREMPRFMPPAKDSKSVVLSRSLAAGQPTKKPTPAARVQSSTSPTFDLLGSIFNEQAKLHMNSSHIRINIDGSLQATKPIKVPNLDNPQSPTFGMSALLPAGGASSQADRVESAGQGMLGQEDPESLVGESTGNKSPVGESTGKKSPVGESTGNKSPVGESTEKKSPGVESTGHKSPIGENAGNKCPVGESSGNKSPVGENTGHKSPVGESTGHKSPDGLKAEEETGDGCSTESNVNDGPSMNEESVPPQGNTSDEKTGAALAQETCESPNKPSSQQTAEPGSETGGKRKRVRKSRWSDVTEDDIVNSAPVKIPKIEEEDDVPALPPEAIAYLLATSSSSTQGRDGNDSLPVSGPEGSQPTLPDFVGKTAIGDSERQENETDLNRLVDSASQQQRGEEDRPSRDSQDLRKYPKNETENRDEAPTDNNLDNRTRNSQQRSNRRSRERDRGSRRSRSRERDRESRRSRSRDRSSRRSRSRERESLGSRSREGRSYRQERDSSPRRGNRDRYDQDRFGRDRDRFGRDRDRFGRERRARSSDRGDGTENRQSRHSRSPVVDRSDRIREQRQREDEDRFTKAGWRSVDSDRPQGRNRNDNGRRRDFGYKERNEDRMGSDRMGNDRMGSDRMGIDRMGSDRMGVDRMGIDRMGNDRMGSDRMGNERMGSDRMANDRMGSEVWQHGSERESSSVPDKELIEPLAESKREEEPAEVIERPTTGEQDFFPQQGQFHQPPPLLPFPQHSAMFNLPPPMLRPFSMPPMAPPIPPPLLPPHIPPVQLPHTGIPPVHLPHMPSVPPSHAIPVPPPQASVHQMPNSLQVAADFKNFDQPERLSSPPPPPPPPLSALGFPGESSQTVASSQGDVSLASSLATFKAIQQRLLQCMGGSDPNTPTSGSPSMGPGPSAVSAPSLLGASLPGPPAAMKPIGQGAASTSADCSEGEEPMDLDPPPPPDGKDDDFLSRVIEEVKKAIRPYYSSRQISKPQYKEILKKCVPKVSKSGEIKEKKIGFLIAAYVKKLRGGSSK